MSDLLGGIFHSPWLIIGLLIFFFFLIFIIILLAILLNN